jgi:hypothetical protein
VLGRVSALGRRPGSCTERGLAAFLAAQTAPAVTPPRRRPTPVSRPSVAPRAAARARAPRGVAAKVVLGAAGVAVAGTTSLGAARWSAA